MGKDKDDQLDIALLQDTPFHGDFDIIGFIGKGSFGKVYKVLHKLEKKFYALKVLAKSSKPNNRLLHMFRREAEALKTFKCKQVVKMYSFHESSKAMFLLLEYCTGGDISSFIRQRKLVTGKLMREDEISVAVKAVLKGLYFLHNKCNCLHRDIKPGNILVRADVIDMITDDSICIGDMGLCIVLSALVGLKAKLKCGTDCYQSPEQLKNQAYDSV